MQRAMVHAAIRGTPAFYGMAACVLMEWLRVFGAARRTVFAAGANMGALQPFLMERCDHSPRKSGAGHTFRLCLPISFTVLACGPLSPISSAKVTRAPTLRRAKPSSSTLLRWK